jgi:hypothetical protein
MIFTSSYRGSTAGFSERPTTVQKRLTGPWMSSREAETTNAPGRVMPDAYSLSSMDDTVTDSDYFKSLPKIEVQ